MKEQATPQEAIQRILQEKKISCKINYDVLNDLNFQATPKPAEEPAPVSIISETKIDSIPTASRLRKASVTFDLTGEVCRILLLISRMYLYMCQ